MKIINKYIIALLTIVIVSSCVRSSSSCKKAHKRKSDFNKIQYR